MNNWALTSINYFHYPTSITITTTTNNPVHLSFYWTNVKPVRHRNTRTIRGLDTIWGAYFCFVAWNIIEQEEAGDTLVHTFLVPEWEFCQTRYFTFLGTFTGLETPSIAAIFTHHHSGAPPYLVEEQTIGVLWSSILDGVAWGQKLDITNRLVSKLAFYLRRVGFPAGEVWFLIRRTSDDTILWSKKLMNSVGIELIPQWYELDIDPPLFVNEEARISAYASANGAGNLINIYASLIDVKPDEHLFFRYAGGAYTEYPTQDFMYKYTYQQY